MQARRPNVCSGCMGPIEKGDDYYGNSYSAFCQDCGFEKQKKQLVYSIQEKNYTNINNVTKCDFCDAPSIGHLNGKSVCSDHIGSAVEIE